MDPDPCPDTSTSTPERDDAQTVSWTQLHPAPTAAPAQRYRGLRNVGATCYLNSLLQTLYMTPGFRTRLYQSTSSSNDSRLLRELQLLFARLQLRTDRTAIDTTALRQSFGWTSTDVLQQQHDVHECYHVLLEALDVSLQGTPDDHFIHDLYQGTLIDSVQCAACSYKRSHLDTFLDLSLGIPSTLTSVEEAIASFIAPERLVGNNQWHCDVCGTKQDAIKSLSLEQLPPLLTLQLKRFAWDHGTNKATSSVSFPKYLDMNAHHSSTASSPTASPSSKYTQGAATSDTWHSSFDLGAWMGHGPLVYELVSVLVHSGSANGGHYVAYMPSLDDDRHWLCFDDVSVSVISDADLRTTYGLVSSNAGYYESSRAPCAYMLQYRQVDASRSIQCPSNDIIPSRLVDLVHAEAQREHAMQTARHERRAAEAKRQADLAEMLELKIVHGGNDKLLYVSKHTSLTDVTTQAIALYALEIPRDRARLRAYSEYSVFPRETFDDREHCTLATLAIHSRSRLYLEVRPTTDSAWMAYDPTALTLAVRRFVRSTGTTPDHFTEPPEYVQLADDARLDDLLSLLCVKYSTSRNHMRLLEMRAAGYWSIETKVLNPTNDETTLQQTLRADLSLRDGAGIYVEEADDLVSAPSFAKELFVELANKITVLIKTKELTLLRAKNVEDNEICWPFRVDRRQPLQVLKDQVCTFFERPPEAFKLRRGTKTGAELKCLDATIHNLTLMTNSVLWVELGTPLRAGEFAIQIFLHTPWPAEADTSTVVLSPSMLANELSFCTTLVVSAEMLVTDVKARILTVLQRSHPTTTHLRLRELAPKCLLPALSDASTLVGASPRSLSDNHAFAVQILKSPETVSSLDKLVSVVLFDRAHLTFGRAVEITFRTTEPGMYWLDLLLVEIERVFEIPPDAVRVVNPLQTAYMDVTEMAHLSWTQGLRLNELWSLASLSDRLVLSDARVPDKVLSTDELLDLQRRIDAAIKNTNRSVVDVGWSANTVEIASIEPPISRTETTALVLRSSPLTS